MQESTLNPQQKEAVTYGDGPLLIIAGAGTGKTTVITQRITHFILKKNVVPKNILALTFTEKAAHEMQERVDITLPYGYADMWIHTFHGFCDRVLRNDAHYVGLNSDYKLLSGSESLYFLQSHIFDLDLKLFKPIGKPTKFLDTLSGHFSRLADEDITPDEYITWVENQEENDDKEMYRELAYAYKRYQEIKNNESVMDFSDLIANTLLLFRTRKNVLKKYQEQFSCIFVDEFQDTNYAQNELAILLAGERKNITAVADDDQSIYRFRGAAVSNVEQFTNVFPKAKIISLTENYRSTQTILDSAYQLIQHNNPNRLEVKVQINKKLTSNTPIPSVPIQLLHAASAIDEAEEIAKKIEELIKKEKYQYKDIAILVRANNHGHLILDALKQKAIPYRFLGPEFLLQQEEIKDLVAYLLFLTDITDSVSLYRILSMEIFNISAQELNLLLSTAKKNNQTLFEALQEKDHTFLTDKTKEKVENVLDMIQNHLELSKKHAAWHILYQFLNDSQLMATLATVNSIAEEKRVQNIVKFFDLLKKFETGTQNATIFTTAEWISLMLTNGGSPKSPDIDLADEDSVNILTIHSAKGLEFKVVFMVSLVSDRFPSRERSEKIPLPEGILKEHMPIGVDYHLEEERRLFYVGITRAKEKLFFTAANFYGEGKRMKKLSPFIFEATPDIEDKVLQRENISQITELEALSPFSHAHGVKQSLAPYHITYITFSNLQLFDICPLHYKAKVILNIPTPPTAQQSSGISIHKALQRFYERVIANEPHAKKDLLTLLQEEWINEGYTNKKENDESQENAVKLLDEFYDKQCHPPVKPLALELNFSFTLKNGVKASGKIDRIDKTENGIEIIDYKTGEDNPKAKKAHEEQLALYALAATRIKDPILSQKPENITLTIYFLKGNTKKSIHFTKEDLDLFEDKLIATIDEIEHSDFVCSKKPLCKDCEYKILCNA